MDKPTQVLRKSRIRCLRRLFRRCRRVAPQQGPEQPVAPVLRFHIPSPGLLEDEQFYILGVIQSCQAAELRGLRTLKCSKQETAKAILDILGPMEHFRDRPLTLALALEALLQVSTMRPKFSCDMISAILHRTMEAVLQGPEKEEEREELKRHFRLLLGSLLMEAPNPGTLLQLLSISVPMASGVVLGLPPPIPYPTGCPISGAQSLFGPQFGPRPDWPLTLRRSFLLQDLRGYALGESGEAQKQVASGISLLLAVARKFPHLQMTVVCPDLACFRLKPKEDDIIIEDL
nr:uncharacterized protein LOC118075723 [Zootoca vivipara]XP_034953804.1 uncharacterized protein LOC118075723 [Zootoca vivipara]